jgi:hypothetical protein
MPKVYIPNRGPHDYTDAEDFGSLVFCTEGEVDKFDLALMHRQLSTTLSQSESEDYILLTSLASLCCVACSIFVARHGRLNLLLRHKTGYTVRSLHFTKPHTNGTNYPKASALTGP